MDGLSLPRDLLTEVASSLWLPFFFVFCVAGCVDTRNREFNSLSTECVHALETRLMIFLFLRSWKKLTSFSHEWRNPSNRCARLHYHFSLLNHSHWGFIKIYTPLAASTTLSQRENFCVYFFFFSCSPIVGARNRTHVTIFPFLLLLIFSHLRHIQKRKDSFVFRNSNLQC